MLYQNIYQQADLKQSHFSIQKPAFVHLGLTRLRDIVKKFWGKIQAQRQDSKQKIGMQVF